MSYCNSRENRFAQKEERLYQEQYNNQGCLMRIIEYNNATDIIVEFQDEYKERIQTQYYVFLTGQIKNPKFFSSRIGEENINNQGDLMRIIEYNNSKNIIIEFQDEYKAQVITKYCHFLDGGVKNPYHRDVYGFGMIGNKYTARVDGKKTKEYNVWHGVMQRCFSDTWKEKHPQYKNVTCCEEWLLYENFYEWLHAQENFDKWFNGDRWAIDKDILVKGNKTYSPKTCCLVPQYVNNLFIKNELTRGNLPVGVAKDTKLFLAYCNNPLIKKRERLGLHQTPEEAFFTYKQRKEEIIRQVAEIEYSQGNIIKECYDAMIKYEVEIDD